MMTDKTHHSSLREFNGIIKYTRLLERNYSLASYSTVGRAGGEDIIGYISMKKKQFFAKIH